MFEHSYDADLLGGCSEQDRGHFIRMRDAERHLAFCNELLSGERAPKNEKEVNLLHTLLEHAYYQQNPIQKVPEKPEVESESANEEYQQQEIILGWDDEGNGYIPDISDEDKVSIYHRIQKWMESHHNSPAMLDLHLLCGKLLSENLNK
jgi:hypothetical protein